MTNQPTAIMLDEACREWHDRQSAGAGEPTSIRVNPAEYRAIEEHKADEVPRRNPLMLLGLYVQLWKTSRLGTPSPRSHECASPPHRPNRQMRNSDADS